MPGGMPSVTQMAAMDRRPPVNRQPVRQQTQEDEAPPPPYSAEDPEPEATRALQESLAAAAEQQGSDFSPEPSHRRANSTTTSLASASMVTAQTSASRRTSGDRPRPADFPASPAARAGTSNGPSAVSSPSVNPTPAADAPPIDTTNMNDDERRAVEESQLEEAMRASRQAEKERLEYEAAVQASLAQAEEDALRRALAYPGESPAEGSRRSRSGSEEREPRSGRSSKRSSLHAPSVSSVSSGATVRRTGSFNTNKPLPNPTPSPLPPVQEPANESLMDMLASIDFNAPDIKPIQPTLAPQGTGGTGGSRGSFSGASEASIEATVASPQSSSNGSWLSGGTGTATNSAAPSLGTTPTQPTYIHHAEPRLKSKNPFLAPEEQETPPAVTVAGPPRPTRSPPPPPLRSDTNETARPEYDYSSQYLDPSSAEYDHSDSSPQYSPNWRGDAHGLTINTSPRSGTAPSLSSAGATVAHLTPSTGSHSPSGFPFPVAVPSGLPPSPRPNSEISPARNLPPIPQSRSAESLPQGPPPPVPPRAPSSILSHTPSASYPSHHSQASQQPLSQPANAAATATGALELLRAYDTVFLVDDSGALANENWEAASHLLCSLVELAPEGLDVYFLNSKRIGKALKERIDVEELFAGLVPREGKKMGERLEGMLTEYIDRLGREPGVRKLNLVVVTDGGESPFPPPSSHHHLLLLLPNPSQPLMWTGEGREACMGVYADNQASRNRS